MSVLDLSLIHISFVREDFCRFDRLLIVRKQVFGIAHDLDLDEISASHFTGEAGDTDCFLCISCAGCVRQQRYVLRDKVQNILFWSGIGTAQGERDDLGIGIFDCRTDQVGIVFSGTQDKACLLYTSRCV